MVAGSAAACSQSGEAPLAHANHLANSTSPYLLQHAHNPVNWYPWGPEALARAAAENKPIFLSVGYSTCYWCHVMEREVFENEEIAALMNERFVCIKVDREERPDLDKIYMTATQLMTQHGGWPNSVFLTPNLKPFFAGTYFGPTDQPGRPGFGTIVMQLGDAWTNQRERITEVSDRAAAAIANVLTERLATIPKAPMDTALVDRTVEQIAASFDPRDGGFGVAPKLPSDFYYPFLLDVHAQRAKRGETDANTLAIVTTTLDAMAAGGIHDHVGGGFHRYATDAQWRVPHFEKMLYNQAMLTQAYLDAYAATGEERYAATAKDTLRFVADVLTGDRGQFYSALDAETDAVEGAYYTWTPDQVRQVLGDSDADQFFAAFEFADVPIFPGHKHPEGGTLVRRVRGQANTPELSAMLAKLA
ncbi:MAG: thioredoxin domain-containing protein, partial [Phycisphaerae bacterium]|nr:thioredoxin domain-containing protein [Phycisphaerae bacterium]